MELADLERQVRRLRIGFQLLVALILIGLFGFRVYLEARDVRRGFLTLDVDGKSVHVSVSNDGPFVITHLAAIHEKKWTPINPSYAVIDSHGADLNLSDMTWYDILGEKTDPPSKEAKLSALYYRPDQGKPREAAEAP